MAKVTSKLQVTVPKAIADRFGIEPGAEIEWEAAGDMIRVIPPRGRRSPSGTEARLRSFDAATQRQRRRDQAHGRSRPISDRGWRREDLYKRGNAG